MYDPYSRVFRPDMQSNNQLPEWREMGGQDQGEQIGQATGSFVELLKKRMAGGGAGGSKGGAMPGMEGKGGEGGGMQSL